MIAESTATPISLSNVRHRTYVLCVIVNNAYTRQQFVPEEKVISQ
jgi:hypothetical protein